MIRWEIKMISKPNPIRSIGMKVGLTLVLMFNAACNNFLSEVPDNRVAIDKLEKASQLLTDAYSAGSYAFLDQMTDNTSYTRGVTIRPENKVSYEWGNYMDTPNLEDTPSQFWNESYGAIASANEVLAIIDKLPVTSKEDLSHKRAVESEALLTRAYAHFMLVNLFAATYDETSASTDLGVPYVETPETILIKKYKRNSIRSTYDKIETDMLKGIELVDGTFFANSGKYHFNENAALAFASRFYLWKGEHEKCIEFSNKLLGGDPRLFVRDLTSDEFQNAKSSVIVYPQLYVSPNQQSNLMLMRKISFVHITSIAHGPTDDVYDQVYGANPFGETDQRQNPAFVKGDNGRFPPVYENFIERKSLNSSSGIPYHIAIAFRGEEVLLNRAESYAEINNIDDAIADLGILMDRRYEGSHTLTIDMLRNFYGVSGNLFVSDKIVLLEYILFERRKEFLAQGLRWFDIKRFNLSVTHVLEDRVSTIELERDDLRKILQIPQSAIDVGGLKSNPR